MFTDTMKRVLILYAGGSLAVNVVILQAFLGTGSLDLPALLSVMLIAVALPMLIGLLLTLHFSLKQFTDTDEVRISRLGVIGLFTTLMAVLAALFHTSWIACLLFVVSMIGTYFIMPDKTFGLLKSLANRFKK